MCEHTRRAVLSGVVGALGATAGCGISLGTLDLTIRNCREEAVEIAVAITALADETTVYDDSHRVPGDSCVDLKDAPVAVEDVFESAGAYRVRAEGPALDAVEATVEFDRQTVEQNEDSVSISVRDDGIRI